MTELVGLLDFVPAASPRFARPNHLAPVAALIERSAREPVRAVISLPPRHGKTELVKHAIAWRLLPDPALRVIFASYAQRFAEKKSREVRSLFRRIGGPLAPDATAWADPVAPRIPAEPIDAERAVALAFSLEAT